MRDFVRHLYLRIGIHKAPKGSWLYALHQAVRSLDFHGTKGPLQAVADAVLAQLEQRMPKNNKVRLHG